MDEDTLLISSRGPVGQRTIQVYNRAAGGPWQSGGALPGSSIPAIGSSFALSGDVLLAGTYVGNSSVSSGVNVFREQVDGTWTLSDTLTASDSVADDRFGGSVAIDGRLAVIGASAGPPLSGAAYVFEQGDDGQFRELARLTPDESLPHSDFGASVAIAGETIVVAGANAHATAYVFKPAQDGTWTQRAALVPSDDQSFTYSLGRVAIHDDTVIVGAPLHTNEGRIPGAAYIHREDDQGNWHQVAELSVGAEWGGGAFGHSVAIGDGWAIVGSPGDDDAGGGGVDAGLAFVFRENGLGQWNLAYTLAAGDGQPGDGFGRSVAAFGTMMVVGAPFHDTPVFAGGAAYVFVVPEPTMSTFVLLVYAVGGVYLGRRKTTGP